MLKLKKLQILGFKSFCDRTELKFNGEGVAAIIGPNGCGKSNIADAIGWVLGEQSAKTLRGSRMEDVIFAGTRDRKPTGMAEVSMTLIDPEVYEGGDANEPTEFDIQEEMPAEAADDWDEAAIRARAAEEAEAYLEEVQPGKIEGEEGAAPAGITTIDWQLGLQSSWANQKSYGNTNASRQTLSHPPVVFDVKVWVVFSGLGLVGFNAQRVSSNSGQG